jgi:hypothetical protein
MDTMTSHLHQLYLMMVGAAGMDLLVVRTVRFDIAPAGKEVAQTEIKKNQYKNLFIFYKTQT